MVSSSTDRGIEARQPEWGETLGILQLVDALRPGGLERVAVNIANRLPRERFRSHLGASRADGPLAAQVSGDVGRSSLHRRTRLDLRAVFRLRSFLAKHRIAIIHAHGTAVFIAVLAAAFRRSTSVIWHNHCGRLASESRPPWFWRWIANRVRGTMVVSRLLERWSLEVLRLRQERLWYVPNFVVPNPESTLSSELPGAGCLRVVCVANLVPDKDHLTLLRAMKAVVEQVPGVHLLLVGGAGAGEWPARINATISEVGLQGVVTLMGQRDDVAAILAASDIAVLSSVSEGFPMVLLEYGQAGLPVVATRVGECEHILGAGSAGLLVPPSSYGALASAILSLARSEGLRRKLGKCLRERVDAEFSPRVVIPQYCRIYELVAAAGRGERV